MGCEYYDDSNSFYCGAGDDEDFTAEEMCCACGGGSQTRYPTSVPTVTFGPTRTFTPTKALVVVSTYEPLKDNVVANTGAVIDVAGDIMFPTEIGLAAGSEVHIRSSIGAVLSAGFSSGLFYVSGGAHLILTSLCLSEGLRVNDDNDGTGCGLLGLCSLGVLNAGGAIQVVNGALTVVSSTFFDNAAGFGGGIFPLVFDGADLGLHVQIQFG
jgi:hypothetical protein